MAAYEKQQQPPMYYGAPVPPPPQPAYYPPPPPPAPRRGGPRSLLCFLFKVVAVIIIVLGAATLILWLIFRPDAPRAYADSAALSRFDLAGNSGGGGGNLLQYNLTVNIRLQNPNKFGIGYDYAEAQAFYDGDRFGFDPLQPFYLGAKSDARFTATFAGSAVVEDGDARRTYGRENGEGFYYVRVRVYSDLSFKVRVFRLRDYRSKITCVLRLPAPPAGGNANATAAMTTLGTRCDVDF
ncbi:hypothetical protein HU200_026214 [Digitaria exilis]|uniref:Late embryogenesis abundant protein LEA-2 subgroup domain-containing protein n=1 Tax=Digitaria exilis TaxID=1010633 RepID=A0A835C9W8_9POAL|nr:hypothetical protein HU200_026214 [Digitaria exilis]